MQRCACTCPCAQHPICSRAHPARLPAPRIFGFDAGGVGVGALGLATYAQTFYYSGQLPLSNMPQVRLSGRPLLWASVINQSITFRVHGEPAECDGDGGAQLAEVCLAGSGCWCACWRAASSASVSLAACPPRRRRPLGRSVPPAACRTTRPCREPSVGPAWPRCPLWAAVPQQPPLPGTPRKLKTRCTASSASPTRPWWWCPLRQATTPPLAALAVPAAATAAAVTPAAATASKMR